MHIGRGLLVLTLVSLFSLTARADEGTDDYKRGDYDAAFKYFLPKAQLGDADAQAKIGYLFEHGRGKPKLRITSAHYTLRASEYHETVHKQ